MEKDEKIILQCDCHGEIMVATSNKEEKTFDFAFYSYGAYCEAPGLWYRIKYAWNHLRTGKIYSDFIILDTKKAKELADFINSNVKE